MFSEDFITCKLDIGTGTEAKIIDNGKTNNIKINIDTYNFRFNEILLNGYALYPNRISLFLIANSI